MTGRTLAEVRRFKADAESAARRGEPTQITKRSALTISDYWTGWSATYPIRESTRREYEKSFALHVKPHLQDADGVG